MSKQTIDQEEKRPLISVVTPTIGRSILIKTLNTLLATTRADEMEYIVVGVIPPGETLDRLKELMKANPRIQHIPVRFERGDASEKRNAGFRAGSADIISFLDDDLYVPPDWPDRILEAFAEPDVGMVSGPALVPDDVSRPARLAGMSLSSRGAGYVAGRYVKGAPIMRKVKWSRTIGCNMSFRRAVFEELGGFSPDFYPGEEMIAANRVAKNGHSLIFHPDAFVFHYPRHSFRKFWIQIWKYGATRIRLIRAGLDCEYTTLIPGVWVLSLVVCGTGVLFSIYFLWLLLLDLFLYMLADLWITMGVFSRTRRPIDLCLFFLLPYMHLSYGLACWVELFSPNKDLGDTL